MKPNSEIPDFLRPGALIRHREEKGRHWVADWTWVAGDAYGTPRNTVSSSVGVVASPGAVALVTAVEVHGNIDEGNVKVRVHALVEGQVANSFSFCDMWKSNWEAA